MAKIHLLNYLYCLRITHLDIVFLIHRKIKDAKISIQINLERLIL